MKSPEEWLRSLPLSQGPWAAHCVLGAREGAAGCW